MSGCTWQMRFPAEALLLPLMTARTFRNSDLMLLAVGLTKILSEKVTSICDRRHDRLLVGAFQATFPQERFDKGFDLVFYELVGRTGDDKVIRKPDKVDLWTSPRAPLPDVAWKGFP